MIQKNKVHIFGTLQLAQFRYDDESFSSTYLGGNGVIAGLAASKKATAYLHCVMGTDITKDMLITLLPTVNISYIDQMPGKTFSYKVTYDHQSDEVINEQIEFGVYKNYLPNTSDLRFDNNDLILFSGSNPQQGLHIVSNFSLSNIAVDTYIYHLQHNYVNSTKLIKLAKYLFINEHEAKIIEKKEGSNLINLFPNLDYIFKKKGSKGLDIISKKGLTSFPPKEVVDPQTPINAGDALSGTIMGLLATDKSLETDAEEIAMLSQDEARKAIQNDEFYRKEINL